MFCYKLLDFFVKMKYNKKRKGAVEMSTKELASIIFENLTEEQLKGFVMMFRNVVSGVPNDETIAAIEECEKMLSDPDTVRYSAEEALRELKS